MILNFNPSFQNSEELAVVMFHLTRQMYTILIVSLPSLGDLIVEMSHLTRQMYETLIHS